MNRTVPGRNIRTLKDSEASLLDYKRSQVWLRTIVHTGFIYWGEVKIRTQVRTQVNTIGMGQVNALSQIRVAGMKHGQKRYKGNTREEKDKRTYCGDTSPMTRSVRIMTGEHGPA